MTILLREKFIGAASTPVVGTTLEGLIAEDALWYNASGSTGTAVSSGSDSVICSTSTPLTIEAHKSGSANFITLPLPFTVVATLDAGTFFAGNTANINISGASLSIQISAVDAGGFDFSVYNGTTTVTYNDPSSAGSHEAAIKVEGSRVKFYIDGALISTQNITTTSVINNIAVSLMNLGAASSSVAGLSITTGSNMPTYAGGLGDEAGGDVPIDLTFKVGSITTNPSYSLDGVLDELRLTKGLSRPVSDGIQSAPWPDPATSGGGGGEPDQGWVDITATRAGFPSQTKRFTVTKALAGADGGAGSVGPTGPRGNVNIAVITTGTAWSDAAAVAGLSAAGYGPPQILDIVTLYRTDGTFTETRFYDGAALLVLTQYINGNLLVDGTLAADKIVTGSITTDKLQVGSATSINLNTTAVDSITITTGDTFTNDDHIASTLTLSGTPINITGWSRIAVNIASTSCTHVTVAASAVLKTGAGVFVSGGNYGVTTSMTNYISPTSRGVVVTLPIIDRMGLSLSGSHQIGVRYTLNYYDSTNTPLAAPAGSLGSIISQLLLVENKV